MDFDMNNLLQQAQQMQEKMKKAQEEAANAEVTRRRGDPCCGRAVVGGWGAFGRTGRFIVCW